MAKADNTNVIAEIIEKCFLIRIVEQKFLQLFTEGKLFGTVHTCIGQELIAVTVAKQLQDEDWVFSNHRCHGHFIAKTDKVEELIAEIMGKTTGVCGGWGGSQHLCSGRFFSNGIQGGIVPVAAGLALGEKFRNSSNITVVFVGEGTLGEGVVYEAANLGSKWDLPLLIVLENNYYSQSTSQSETLAGDITKRFEAFGIKTFKADTWNVENLLQTAEKAVLQVRKKSKPAFLLVETYRLVAHSKGDDDRDSAEVQEFWDKDLLAIFKKENPEKAKAIIENVDNRINTAVEKGLAAPYAGSRTGDSKTIVPCKWLPTKMDTHPRCVEAIRDCFSQRMKEDPRIVMLGEDICSPYGGAFKVTKGLSDLFPERVKNTSISEAAIVGLGNGLALNGMLPICEIMFGDFLTLAFDQLLNHASKFPGMYNGKVKVPLIVRTPMGGKRGYGPTHSQSIEKHFLGLPQTLVLALHSRFNPAEIYNRLFANIDRMTLVIENKLLYAKRLSDKVVDGFVLEHSDELYPTSRIRPEGTPDLTVVCYGGMLPDVESAIEQAFDKYEVICEIICPVQLYPHNPAPVLESLSHTNRLLVVEEGPQFAAFGSEVITRVMEEYPAGLKRVMRYSAPALSIPSSGPLEKQFLPGVESILKAILEITRNG